MTDESDGNETEDEQYGGTEDTEPTTTIDEDEDEDADDDADDGADGATE
ncbi:hypothetical protein [Natrinema sp. SYSU A 869]|nr:hypothetical protein [Natrinema sp. SYSU A 869]